MLLDIHLPGVQGFDTLPALPQAAPGVQVLMLTMSEEVADLASALPADPLAELSPREREILDQIARGASNKEIARTLAIAETTVKIHVQHILRKLNLSSRVQAAVLVAGKVAVTRG